MRPHVVWGVLMAHLVVLMVVGDQLNWCGLLMLGVFPGMVMARRRCVEPTKPVDPRDHPSCFWRA